MLHKEAVFTDTESVLDGKYIILRMLGRGAYGEVFLTEHKSLHVYRAVKRILKSRDKYHTGRNEVDILKSLSHNSLPIIYDIYEDDVYFYIVEEYIEGKTLREYVNQKGKLCQNEAVLFCDKICDVLQYMQNHGGICHLDLKPENIIVIDDHIKLLDFGSGITVGKKCGAISGTKGYAAPELYCGGSIGTSSDIYSVGMILIYMLLGHLDFKHFNTEFKQIKNNISKNLYSIILKCICHEQSDRFACAEELKNALKKSRIQNNATENPLIITVSGCGRGVGATHLAVMLAVGLNKTRKCSLLVRQRHKSVLEALPLYVSTKKIKYEAGRYRIDGLQVIPDYHGHADLIDKAHMNCVIIDCGTVTEMLSGGVESEVFEYVKKSDKCEVKNIVVVGHSFKELNEYLRIDRLLRENNIDFVTAVNFTDALEYMRVKKEYKLKEAFRIPYCTNPYNIEGWDVECEIIYKEKRKKGDSRRIWSAKKLWNLTFGLVNRKLSDLRLRKKGCYH